MPPSARRQRSPASRPAAPLGCLIQQCLGAEGRRWARGREDPPAVWYASQREPVLPCCSVRPGRPARASKLMRRVCRATAARGCVAEAGARRGRPQHRLAQSPQPRHHSRFLPYPRPYRGHSTLRLLPWPLFHPAHLHPQHCSEPPRPK
eukprot:scaffold33435_cov112-Isochrysis_galbana.AAC.2